MQSTLLLQPSELKTFLSRKARYALCKADVGTEIINMMLTDRYQPSSFSSAVLDKGLVAPKRPLGLVLMVYEKRFADPFFAALLEGANFASFFFEIDPAEVDRFNDTQRERFWYTLSRMVGEVASDLSEKIKAEHHLTHLPIAYFGAGKAAKAALLAAAEANKNEESVDLLRSLVLFDPVIDVSEQILKQVKTPVLTVVAGENDQEIQACAHALEFMSGDRHLETIPGVDGLGMKGDLNRIALEAASHLALDWFERWFIGGHSEDWLRPAV
jgi:hypothetical protein